MELSDEILELIDAAQNARENAYAPYSNFKVGAALRLKDGTLITGVNIENCSYGLTVCAERNAIAAALGAGAQKGDIMTVAVVVDAAEVASPCGACRQVLAEIVSLETPVVLHNLRFSQTLVMKLSELLPVAFLPESLSRALNQPDD